MSIALDVELRNGDGDGIRFEGSLDSEASDDPTVELRSFKVPGGLDLMVIPEAESLELLEAIDGFSPIDVDVSCLTSLAWFCGERCLSSSSN
jgi:hypothetical protein